MDKEIELMKKALRQKRKVNKEPEIDKINPDDFLSSGSTLINMACTGRTYACFIKGYFFYFIGDSSSGKTFLVMTCLAEACRKASFDNYDLVYNGTTERGALMDFEKFFGRSMAERIQTIYTDTIEEFYYDVDDRLEKKKPFIYILDSMDGLNSDDDNAKFKKRKHAHQKRKSGESTDKVAGSFGDGKAKKNSQDLRKMLTRLHESGSILIMISQSRDNLGFGMETRTRAGGRALKFYAALEMWTSIYKHIKKNYRGKDREQGIISRIQVKKNRVAGRDRVVEVPIYHSYGIDDIGSCVDYLVSEKHWSNTNGSINAKSLGFKGKREALILHIQKENLERELRAEVRKCWEGIEAAVAIKRKPKYA